MDKQSSITNSNKSVNFNNIPRIMYEIEALSSIYLVLQYINNLILI